MKLSRGITTCGALMWVVVLLLAGCVLLPQRATAIEQLAGEWVFVDPDGVSSTLIIDESGRFTVDRAPEEVFRVLGGGDGFIDWDRIIDWDRAQPASGDAVIDQLGRVYFSTSNPDWGAREAYQATSGQSLQFFIGNRDNEDSIRYVRADD